MLFDALNSKLAFPGRQIDQGMDPLVAIMSELEDECDVYGANPVLFGVKFKPGRLPSYVFLVELDPKAAL